MKRLLPLLLCFALCLMPVTPVLASAPSVVDKSDLLTSSEEATLEAELDAISVGYGVDVVVLTVDSLDGKSAMAYADDYYDYNGYGDDGVLLLVCMDEREWWISTAGSCMYSISSSDIDYIGNRFVPDLSAGNYYSAFHTFGYYCERELQAGSDSYNDNYYYDDYYDTDYDSDYDSSSDTGPGILMCLMIGAVIGLIVVAVMAMGMRSARPKSSAESYVRNGSLNLTARSDRFLYHTVNRTAKPQNNSSGGSRGGFHSGSSGRSHGGGGGRF